MTRILDQSKDETKNYKDENVSRLLAKRNDNSHSTSIRSKQRWNQKLRMRMLVWKIE